MVRLISEQDNTVGILPSAKIVNLVRVVGCPLFDKSTGSAGCFGCIYVTVCET